MFASSWYGCQVNDSKRSLREGFAMSAAHRGSNESLPKLTAHALVVSQQMFRRSKLSDGRLTFRG